ncbi:MAG TPA: hypothetical protein DCZ01_10175 [Elusimicrobia bacterium]|nr:MAG: hypothetical protein A2X37_07215 [Elusimicrobia bacterium GWA2_66_18]OGR76708.1 MAG: hypothetical protein A2X40_02145 [Elusimicrobia bacterium GWC2_65_9]HAZ08865.1 hypothetical protein [Elusimicrobiota bacterium]
MNQFVPTARTSRKTLVLGLLGVGLFLALEALLVRHFVRTDTRPPSWDQSIHMEIALDYKEAIHDGRFGDFWYLAPKPGMPPFPPAYHLLLRSAYSSLDPARAALWVNWGYMAVLALSIFCIAWRFLPDSRALAATLAFCAAPGLQDLLTTQLVDLAVVAWTAAAYWALLSSEGFTLWLPSLAFGVLHAAGMLHKWSFFSYLLPAYLVWARSLAGRRTRWRALAAAALSLALFAPWYWAHIALLPSRLFQASSDFAVPFWKGGAWAVYSRQSCGSLGPLLWALGFVGLLAPQYARRRENGWLLAAWVFFSYVFWTIVPNRQIRFLLPGLAPLAVALAATWPSAVSWSVAAVQVLGAVNFAFGWVGPLQVNTLVAPLVFFENRPPAREDWKTEEILKRIEAERDVSRPLTNVTLVANDYYFNAPTFHWTQRRLGLPHVRMRGVNKRLCELSEFLLLKDGKIGPEGVISGLPEAAKIVKDPESWFHTAYEKAASWPLPDGSSAALYRQRRNRRRPVAQKHLSYQFFEAGTAQVRAMRLDFGEWDRTISAWKTSSLKAERVDVRDLVVRGVAADLEGFSFSSLYEDVRGDLIDWNDVRLMRLTRLKVKRLSISEEDLRKFLEKRVPGLQIASLRLDATIKAEGSWQGKDFTLEAVPELDAPARRLRARVLSASWMGTPLPTSLFRPIKELSLSLDPNPETPFFIDLPGLSVKAGRLSIP